MRIDRVLLGVAAVMLLMVAVVEQGRAAVFAVSLNSFADSGATKHDLSAADLKARIDKNQSVIIMDARTDLAGQIIKGAIHVPISKVEEWAKGADRNATIVTYCTCPHDEAAEAEMKKLREMGFENAFTLSGGLDAARKAGLEIVAPSE